MISRKAYIVGALVAGVVLVAAFAALTRTSQFRLPPELAFIEERALRVQPGKPWSFAAGNTLPNGSVALVDTAYERREYRCSMSEAALAVAARRHLLPHQGWGMTFPAANSQHFLAMKSNGSVKPLLMVQSYPATDPISRSGMAEVDVHVWNLERPIPFWRIKWSDLLDSVGL